jgi:AIG2-like family
MPGDAGSRRADVFFYGLFMDQELLRAKGLVPTNVELAWIDGYRLRIGQRASLIQAPGTRVHGVIMTLTLGELDQLYSEPSVQVYRPIALLVRPASGGVVAALCYNLPSSPAVTERNPEYAARLRALAQRVGLPQEYVSQIE